MRQYASEHITRAKIYEGSEEAKQGRVRELEQRAQDGDDEWNFRVRDAEFIEVMQVCYTEVQGCQENNLRAGEVAKGVERHDEGPPDELFTDGTLDDCQNTTP